MADLDAEYLKDGLAAGLTKQQLQFLDAYFPGYEHHHSIEEVDGLEEALESSAVEDDDDDEES